jgi:hypothetical protein
MHRSIPVGLLAVALAAGCTLTSSENVKTRGIYARFVVTHDQNDEVWAQASLRVGGPLGTVVDLTGGEYVACNDQELTEWVEPITGYHWSASDVALAPSGAYVFDFVRLDETVTSEVTMPARPTILGTDPVDGVLTAGDRLAVTWDASDPGDQVTLSLQGPCIFGISEVRYDDDGAHTFTAAVADRDPALPEACALTLTVTRVNEGDVSPEYQGGTLVVVP